MDDFVPNSWNPNKMSARDYATLLHDIETFGFVDPLTVRPDPRKRVRFEIIDGENRWRAARDLDIAPLYFDVGPVTDDVAQKLTITLNELRGQYDPRAMGDLLSSLLEKETPAQLLEVLPFTEEAIAGLVGNFDWQKLAEPGTPAEKPAPAWVERTFRLPPDVAEVVRQALAKAKTIGGYSEDWQGLEMLAAEYLAS